MKKIVGCVVFLILMLGMFCPALAAPSGWEEMDVLEHGTALRYDLAVPVHTAFVAQNGKMLYQCQADPGDANAMLLNWKYVDANDNLVQVGEWEDFLICIPYPQGHDAAMGYEYVITNTATQQTWKKLDAFEQAISFRTELGQAQGSYRISWSSTPDPKPAAWELIMDRMNWSGDRYSYTVGAGSKMVSVTRQGRDVTISGGEIKGVVRFANKGNGEDFEAERGWHTEEGHYTFQNVTLLEDIYVWAYSGEDYTITLDSTVKGNYGVLCVLRNGANLDLINNDIIYCKSDYSMIIESDTSCSMSITGNGKILIGEGWDWSDGNATSKDEVPIRFLLLSTSHTNEKALQDIKEFEGKVVVSYDQVETSEGYPMIRSYCSYLPDPNDPYLAETVIDPETGRQCQLNAEYIVKKLRPAKGVMTEPVAASSSQLKEGALYRPLLVTSERVNDTLYLRSEIVEEVYGHSVRYEIHLVDSLDAKTQLPGRSALYIPYPEGMDQNSALLYDVTINHTTDSGVETFSTKDGTISVTPYGFRIQVYSLSPFELSWQKAQNVTPPSTGDSAYPGVYAALMLLSLAVIVSFARKKA